MEEDLGLPDGHDAKGVLSRGVSLGGHGRDLSCVVNVCTMGLFMMVVLTHVYEKPKQKPIFHVSRKKLDT